MTIRATAGASPRWGIPEDCLEADHMIDARTKTGTAPDEHSDRREPADQRMLTDVSRLRSYRCTIKLAAAPTITVRRIHSHARSLTTGHESNPGVGAPRPWIASRSLSSGRPLRAGPVGSQ